MFTPAAAASSWTPSVPLSLPASPYGRPPHCRSSSPTGCRWPTGSTTTTTASAGWSAACTVAPGSGCASSACCAHCRCRRPFGRRRWAAHGRWRSGTSSSASCAGAAGLADRCERRHGPRCSCRCCSGAGAMRLRRRCPSPPRRLHCARLSRRSSGWAGGWCDYFWVFGVPAAPWRRWYWDGAG